MTDLHTTTWNEGTPVILVHGSIATGEEAWEAQRPLAEAGFRLVVPDRRGHGRSPQADAEDYRRDAEDLVALLDAGPAHLVGHSYGGLSAMLAAAQRPEHVLPLVLAEPPAFSICRDVPAVRSFVEEQAALWAQAEFDDREFLERFLQAVGAPLEDLPAEMLDHWTTMVGTMRRGALAWEAEIPLEALASAPFPSSSSRGRTMPPSTRVCDGLARRLNAERAIVAGAGHEVQMVAAAFNERMAAFWRAAA